ncbi:thialysine N-epsilon-acetyltransferase-like [Chrysoperla carnea]|uniref:thialysine N-epsilon-acetyltransferase-like n=1 Tax=Chrysoperla carnea TaxID=189513 RepID=UPI001D07A5DF|nr:thialysine N-epsilon-acetyltransferase-like [Chrysoperla carnea]
MDFNNIRIRKAVSNDMIYVAAMIKELAAFENLPDAPQIDHKKLIEDGFESKKPAFKCFVAECLSTNTLVGHAIYFPIYSSWEGRSMFLEDLFVKREYRNHHIGSNLIKAIAKEAFNENCIRIDLHLLSSESPARGFYKKLNAVNLTKNGEGSDWNYVRFRKEAIAKLAE